MDWSLIGQVLQAEWILLAGIVLGLLMSLCPTNKKHVQSLSSLALFAAFVSVFMQILPAEPTKIVFASFVQDGLSVYMRVLIYLASFLICFGSGKYIKQLESPAEYYPIFLTATLGAGFLTGANDLLTMFIALETLGLSAILLSSYARLNQASNEAGIKYLINSAVATAILLLGGSFLYGLTSQINFDKIAEAIVTINKYAAISPQLVVLIVVCLLGAIAFKLAAAPFHNWSPDVYSGAPTTTTAYLSVVSKTAAFAFAIRILVKLISVNFGVALFTNLLAVIAILSIIVGNSVGLIQMISRGSMKRLLAYSSIAQAGYMLMALACFGNMSIQSLIIYLSIYALMNTGAFMAAVYIEQETGSDQIYDAAGLMTKRPKMTILFALCLINLAGLPFIPAGFIAKFLLFFAAWSHPVVAFGKLLAIVGLVGSLVALFYYLYLVKVVAVDPPSNAVTAIEGGECDDCPTKGGSPNLAKLSTLFSVVLLAVFGIFGMQFVRKIAEAVVSGIG